jgi:hypothetical protein
MFARGALMMSAALFAASPTSAADGTVSANFFFFSGPYASIVVGADPTDPNEFNLVGVINGSRPTNVIRAGNPPAPSPIRWVIGSMPLSGTSVTFAYDVPGAPANVISFTPTPFTGIAAGQDFSLGTISFTNGGWFGDASEPTFLGLDIETMSGMPGFSQSLRLSIAMIPVTASPSDCGTLAGQQAQADALVVYVASSEGFGTSAYAYEPFCAPPGLTNTASFDLVARFGSLEFAGLANPDGGFLAASPAGIPGSAPALPGGIIPEPGT